MILALLQAFEEIRRRHSANRATVQSEERRADGVDSIVSDVFRVADGRVHSNKQLAMPIFSSARS